MTREEKVSAAQAMRADGVSYPRIASELSVSRNTARRWCDPGFAELGRAASRRWKAEHQEELRAYEKSLGGTCACGARTTRGRETCQACREEQTRAYRRLVEEMWAEGMTARQIAEELGWKIGDPNTKLSLLRSRGYNLPHRRTPEQVARITAGTDERLRKAREIYREQQLQAAA